MGTQSDLHYQGSVIRFEPEILDPMEPRLFDVQWLKSEGHHRGTSPGRGETHFFSFDGYDLVLRHFRRGGLVGRFNRDFYVRGGLEKSRSIREHELLRWMRAEGLPVPRPVAASVTPTGPLYRAAIITERIPGARPLEDRLREGAMPQDVWQRVGLVIRQMHDAGVFHSDLNLRNILIDSAEKVSVIDFDKCERRPPGAWQTENLDRLQRSLRKQTGQKQTLYWDKNDWATLIK
ncbi:MAG: 3-deoxy-D-manno-octulosonic acid kinase, partial [Pseudomonadota bacterium]